MFLLDQVKPWALTFFQLSDNEFNAQSQSNKGQSGRLTNYAEPASLPLFRKLVRLTPTTLGLLSSRALSSVGVDVIGRKDQAVQLFFQPDSLTATIYSVKPLGGLGLWSAVQAENILGIPGNCRLEILKGHFVGVQSGGY